MDKKVLEYERFRFKTMTHDRLYTRLYKIKDVEKLRAFIMVADEFNYPGLRQRAETRLEFIQENVLPPTTGLSYEQERRRERRINRDKRKEEQIKRQVRAELEEGYIKKSELPVAPSVNQDKPKRSIEF